MKKFLKVVSSLALSAFMCLSFSVCSFASEGQNLQPVEQQLQNLNLNPSTDGVAFVTDDERSIIGFCYMTASVISKGNGKYCVAWSPVPVGLELYNTTGFLEVRTGDGDFLYCQRIIGGPNTTVPFDVPETCDEIEVEISNITYYTSMGSEPILGSDYSKTFRV